MQEIKLTNEEPLRLDKALTEVLSETRSQIQKLIRNEGVFVDGKVATARQQVTKDQKVEMVEKEPIPEKDLSSVPKLDILFENDDMLAVNKPAGLIVHVAANPHEITLVDLLLLERPEIAGIGENENRPGIVHRLDRHASGVMVIAKTQPAYEHLKAQFKGRLTKKYYSVLVHGSVPKEHDTLTFPIDRAKSHGRMAAKSLEQGGREAITHYTVKERYAHLTLLDVNTETGRTHQIRVHMFALGNPVYGDHLYKSKLFKPVKLGRIYLHARELTITIPGGEEKTFTAPLPEELANITEGIPTV